MERSRLPYHPVQEHIHILQHAFAMRLFEDQHHLLRTADGKDWNQDFTAPLDGAVDNLGQLAHPLLARRLEVLETAVGRLQHQCLHARETVDCPVEKPGVLELYVAREYDVVLAITNVEVGARRAKDMARVVERQFQVGGNVGRVAEVERDAVAHLLPDMLAAVGHFLAFSVLDLDVVGLQQRRQIACRRGAVDWPVEAVDKEHRQQRRVV